MKSSVKKIIMVLSCLTILLSSMTLTSAFEYNSNNQDSNIVTIYRYGPDGNIMPVTLSVDKESKNLKKILINKCKELLENDSQIQDFLNNLTFNFTVDAGYLFIKSQGRGFHFKTKTEVRILAKFKLFKLMMPRIKVRTNKDLVFCRYYNDEKANTTIKPIIRNMMGQNATKYVEGNHSILVSNFVGFTTWCGRFSFSPFDIMPRAFIGYGRLTLCNKFG